MLVERAEKLEALVDQSQVWVQNCCSPEERESRLQELNRIGRETRLMRRVSERRTSVILFGLSQAGKSLRLELDRVPQPGLGQHRQAVEP